ncbi:MULTISPECIES: SAM-dependent methyltransferase [unclassified Streptomyces]|uniref:SAM-dependent methyltransferase n=1 Tax=unclassified Streptomyces TaxID=2593676 RepID=UPI00036E9EA3|nr:MULTISPECIES: SAM-dependent methyltransferase [unclassified Streptomyces]MYY01995.1 SAM-dependent methyltransferase [Streptomyces sp. SID4913]
MSADAPAPDAAELRRRIDTTKAHPARVYDVFLGGKDNYPADREAAAMALAANPRGYLTVRHNRDFMRRAVTLAANEGVRQFLDIGTGLPTQQNVHQIAQALAPESRVVYVDNDPVVLVHAQALLTSGPEGRTDYIEADLREPDRILEAARRTLDLDRPVALVLAAVLHFIEDETAHPVVQQLVGSLAPGSFVVLSNVSSDLNTEQVGSITKGFKERGFAMVRRSHSQMERFVTDNGLELLDPGIVPVHRWRPERVVDLPEARNPDPEFVADLDELDRTRYLDINDVTDADVSVYGLVARKH